MSYKLNNNQHGLDKGFARYDFYYKHNGRQNRKTIKCKRAVVEDLYIEWRNNLCRGSEPGQNQLLFEILDEYLKFSFSFKGKEHAKSEERVIEGAVKKFFPPKIFLHQVKRGDVDAFRVWRKNNPLHDINNTREAGRVSDATVNRSMSVMSYFFNWCIDNGYTTHNPFVRSKIRENNIREVFLKSGQIKELLNRAYDISSTFHRVVTILLLTGMRKAELFTLEWNEVNLEKRFIYISHHKTKSRRMRPIPVSPSLHTILSEMYSSSVDNQVISGYTLNILRNDWDKLLSKISFNRINDGSKLAIHDLRHIYSQSLLEENVSLEDIQFILGHESVTTTQSRYAQLARTDLLEKGSRIDNVIDIKDRWPETSQLH